MTVKFCMASLNLPKLLYIKKSAESEAFRFDFIWNDRLRPTACSAERLQIPAFSFSSCYFLHRADGPHSPVDISTVGKDITVASLRGFYLGQLIRDRILTVESQRERKGRTVDLQRAQQQQQMTYLNPEPHISLVQAHRQYFTIHISAGDRQTAVSSSFQPSCFPSFCITPAAASQGTRLQKHFVFLQWREGLHIGHVIGSSSWWTW